MSLASHAERLQARLDRIKEDEKSATERVLHVGEFVGGVAASSALRAYLNKTGKEMPKVLGLDADAAAGAALVVMGFLDMVPGGYSDHMLNVGAGLVAGTIGNKVAGWVNPAIATKGEEPYQLGAGAADTSAYRGSNIVEMIRAQRQTALARHPHTQYKFHP